MSNRDFAKHNGLIAFIAILLVLILVGGIIGGLYYFNRCLFGHDYDENGVCTRCGEEKLDKVEKEPDKEDPNEENKEANVNGGGMATVLPGNGIMLMASKMAPTVGVPTSVVENTWTLTATVNIEADDKYINWSVRWKDGQDAWAKGKTVTEYLTVTPTTAGALTATVKVLKDFGAQIEVVATSRDNTEKSAVCLFDYVQKITGLTFNMPNISGESTSFTYEFQTTAYTVAADLKLELKSVPFSVGSCNLKFTSEFVSELLDQLSQSNIDGTLYLGMSVLSIARDSNSLLFVTSTTVVTSDYSSAAYRSGQYQMPTDPVLQFLFSFKDNTKNLDKFTYAFRQAVNSVEGAHATFDVSFTATYGGKIYSSGDKTIDVKFDGSSFHVPVTDVTLSESHIYA